MPAKSWWLLAILFTLVLGSQRGLGAQAQLFRESPDGSFIITEKVVAPAAAPLVSQGLERLAAIPLGVQIIRGRSGSPMGTPPNWQEPAGARHHKMRLIEAEGSKPSPPTAPSELESTASWEALIQQASQAYGVDPNLVQLVIRRESGYNPTAVSPKGAMGLMQLMPGTAALLGVQDPFNPVQNIDGGVRYLKQCLERFNNNVALALAAYNAGPENVAKYGGIPPFAETQNYVARIMEDYTGQPLVLPAAAPSAAPPAAANPPPAGRKKAASQPDLQPLVLPGGQLVKVLQSGRMKIVEILSP
jgi:hypothetical protein